MVMHIAIFFGGFLVIALHSRRSRRQRRTGILPVSNFRKELKMETGKMPVLRQRLELPRFRVVSKQFGGGDFEEPAMQAQ